MSAIVEYKQSEIISKDRVQLVKDMICRGATDGELELFVMNCNRTGLDPFQKQCWAIKRWDSSLGRETMTFQTGVDGFRIVANRSSKYSGQLGPFWCGEDGVWVDVWLKDKPPVAAKVGVLKSDFKEPLWAVAKFTSYAAKKKDGSLTPFWLKMPDLMIAKVAECLAIRKAFPQDLSGVYSSEEMEQAEIKDVSPTEKPVKAKQVEHVAKDKTEAALTKGMQDICDISIKEKETMEERWDRMIKTIDEPKEVISDKTKAKIEKYKKHLDETRPVINKPELPNHAEEATIGMEQADDLKAYGVQKGYDVSAITYVVKQVTGDDKWGKIKVSQLEEIRKFLK